MATRSTIGVRINEKEREVVYCHWDGYPDYNGRILVEHYNTQEKAEALVKLGNISSLRPRLAPNVNEEHSFDDALENVTIFYGRDRGETEQEPVTLKNSQSVNDHPYGAGEFNYLFDDGEWYVRKGYRGHKRLVKDLL